VRCHSLRVCGISLSQFDTANTLFIANKKLSYTEQIIILVKFTEMVTVEVRCHTDKNLEMPFENKYARVYFMVEIFGGVSSEMGK
jgi:hypothetical protein